MGKGACIQYTSTASQRGDEADSTLTPDATVGWLGARTHTRLELWQLSISPFSLPVTSLPFPFTSQLLYSEVP